MSTQPTHLYACSPTIYGRSREELDRIADDVRAAGFQQAIVSQVKSGATDMLSAVLEVGFYRATNLARAEWEVYLPHIGYVKPEVFVDEPDGRAPIFLFDAGRNAYWRVWESHVPLPAA